MVKKESRNAVIDGWRGISVILVILAHLFAYRLTDRSAFDALDGLGLPFGSKLLQIIASLGGLGVSFFFMISGFLITSLLIAEEKKNDRVSLKAFYVRRVFRIMPPFYLFIAVNYILDRSGSIIVNDDAFLRSSLYLCNFSGFSCSWWLAHTWSLAVEEQFYLLWPFIFVIAPLIRLRSAALIFILMLGSSLMFSPLNGFVYIMAGVLVALHGGLQLRAQRIGQAWIWASLAILLLAPVAPPLAFMKILTPLLVGVVFFGSLYSPRDSRASVMLRHPLLGKIGLISYSLYLWQQTSLAPVEWGGGATGAAILYAELGTMLSLAFIPIAVASYILVEKPMIRLGHRLSSRISTSASRPVSA